MRRYAFLSDIHANLEALESVLRDVERERPDAVIVLGDTVGYGPNPAECLELVASVAEVLLLGNHEKEAIAPAPDEMEGDAREMLEWQVTALESSPAWARLHAEAEATRFEDLAARRIDGFDTFHGSPQNPVAEYVWPGHPSHRVYLNRQLNERIQGYLDGLKVEHGFCGHTHVPSVLTAYAERELFPIQIPFHRKYTFVGPSAVFFVPNQDCVLEGLSGRKLIINPGSVGQPRDGNPEASWALYDGDRVEFHRVHYDFRKTQAKILMLPVSNETKQFFAGRLARGE